MLYSGNEPVDLVAIETLGTHGSSMVLLLQLWGLVFVIPLSGSKYCCGLIYQISAWRESLVEGLYDYTKPEKLIAQKSE